MENISALLALCEGNPPVDSPQKRLVAHIVDVFFDVRLNKRLKNSGVAGDLRRHDGHVTSM